jgi:hypothetical protein
MDDDVEMIRELARFLLVVKDFPHSSPACPKQTLLITVVSWSDLRVPYLLNAHQFRSTFAYEISMYIVI